MQTISCIASRPLAALRCNSFDRLAYGQPPLKKVLVEPELYNLHRDPSERFNVASSNPEAVASLLEAVTRHQAKLVVQPPLFDVRLGLQ